MEHQFNLKSDSCVFVFILLFYFLNDSKGVVNRALETTLKIDHCENKHDSHHPARSRTRGSIQSEWPFHTTTERLCIETIVVPTCPSKQ